MNEDYFKLIQNGEFEKAIKLHAENLILLKPKDVGNEVVLRYLTHVFAMTLDNAASWLIKPKHLN